jgi:hypothetical protein
MTDAQAPPAPETTAPSPAPATAGTDEPQASASQGVPPAVGAAAARAAASAASELPRRAADAVQFVVDTIHDKAVRPALLAARAVVFGLLVAAMATVLTVLGSIALVRLLDVYAFGHRVWASYLLIGGVFTIAGLLVWTRRNARPSPARPH